MAVAWVVVEEMAAQADESTAVAAAVVAESVAAKIRRLF